MRRYTLILLLGALGATQPSPAQELPELLSRIGALAEQRDIPAATALMQQAMVELWSLGTLGVRRAMLVSREADGFGMQQPRSDAVFAPGEPIILYAEPFGYGFVHEDATYAFGFAADLAVLSEDLEVLASQRGFKTWSFRSKHPLFEVYINLTYDLAGAPPGNYVIETTLRDLHREAQTRFRVPIRIEPGDGS